MRPKTYDFDPVNTDADLVAAAQTATGAGNLTLTGSSPTYARQFGVYSAVSATGVTFTITGLDQDGKAKSETIVGPTASGTSETTGYYSSITTVAVSGATTTNVIVGTVDELISQTIPVDYNSDSGAAIGVDVTGTINYTVEQTFDDIQASNLAVQSAHWYPITAFSGKTADVYGTATPGASAIRFKVNSFTDGAEAQMSVSQPPRG